MRVASCHAIKNIRGEIMIYLNLDENNYLLSVASVGRGTPAEVDLSAFDLSGDRIRAHKWENDTLIFDADRLAELEAEQVPHVQESETPTGETSVYDELAAAYKEGVQQA